MKKNQSAETSAKQIPVRATWRRWSAGALLACAVLSTVPPALAQDPAANQATLNFVGADIDSVIKAIGHYTRTTFVIDPRVKGTINLVSEKPVTKAQALQMLTSALRLQGFAVVKTDGFTKVVPEADAKLQAGPIQAGAVRGDQIATQIFHLNYESAAGLVPVLRPLISPNNTINADPSNNTLVITDYADNLKRLGKIIAALDSPASANLDVVPVQYAIATDIAMMVNRLLEASGPVAQPGAAAAAGGNISVLADPRTNSVIVRAPTVARANLAKSLIAKLDQPTSQPGNVHVVYLRNADAIKLAQTLRAVVASDRGDAGTAPAGNAAPQAQAQAQQTSLTSGGQQTQLGGGALNSQQAPTTLPSGGPAGYIQADAATNSLIITASEPVYRNLRTVIDQLDARRAQVYIESLIVEVSADKAAELGIQWLGLSGDKSSAYRIGGGTSFSSAGNNLINQAIAKTTTGNPIAPNNGLNLGIFRQIGGQLTLGALAHALETQDGANILSIPNLVTLDNEEARIIVGQNVPFITGQYTTTASGSSNPFQTIERRDVGLALRVKPQVSEGGTIKLQIYQETSAVQDSTNAAGIITSKRSIESNVLVDDGQIVVLGGLLEDRLTDGTEKVPGLGDVPVLGNLFKYQTRKRTKTNLMVFLRPIVLRNPEQSVDITADRYDYIRGVQRAQQATQSSLLSGSGAPELPPLQNGHPVGGSLVNLPPGVHPIPPVNLPTPGAAPPARENPVPNLNSSPNPSQ
jgi:general secretion pathway protein D